LTKFLSARLYWSMTGITVIVASFIIGMFAGSFFYTLALRFARGEIREKTLRALFSRSRCPSCNMTINPLHLVPVIGFFLLKGRCGKCGSSISFWYPVSEITYGALAALFASRLGVSAYSIDIFLLAGTAVCISIVDLKTLSIPNSLVIAIAALSAYPIFLNGDIADNLYGFAALFAVFIVILLVFPGSFGAGDVKLASVIGLVSGLELSIVILEIALVTGAVSGVLYAVMKKKSLRSKIPFAPFLAVGLIVSFLYGREILLFYYRLIY
jgi:prepilin signal peptidase PulO-like enzyme (type II secretory pathway)